MRSGGACDRAAHGAAHTPRPRLPRGEAVPIGDVLGSRDFVDPQRQAQIETAIRTLRKRVDCPRLATMPLVRVARAVVDGYLPACEVDQLLAGLEAAAQAARKKEPLPGDPPPLRGTRSQYFVGGAKELFSRFALSWETSRPFDRSPTS